MRAIATVCLSGDLHSKLEAIARAGFDDSTTRSFVQCLLMATLDGLYSKLSCRHAGS
jgi:hypothetical protein